MKKVLFAICYVIGFLIGAMLLIFNYETLQRNQPMLRYTMLAAGIIFIIPAIAQLISSLNPKKDEFGNILPKKWYSTVIAVLALLWGIYILVFPMGYADSLGITLGVSLILAGIAQAIWIIRTAESTFVRFIIPSVTLIIGVVIIAFLTKNVQVSAIISGIMLIVWGVNGFFSLRSKRVVAAADQAAKVERKAEKEERKALKHSEKETPEKTEVKTEDEDKDKDKEPEKETKSSDSMAEKVSDAIKEQPSEKKEPDATEEKA